MGTAVRVTPGDDVRQRPNGPHCVHGQYHQLPRS